MGSLQFKHLSTKSDSAIISLQMEQETCKFGLLRECIDLLQSQMLLRRCLSSSLVNKFSFRNGNRGTGFALFLDSCDCVPDSTPSPPAVLYSCFTGPIPKFCAVISVAKESFRTSSLPCRVSNLVRILSLKMLYFVQSGTIRCINRCYVTGHDFHNCFQYISFMSAILLSSCAY
jgi:hypothetical protein